ncbi:MAG: DNA polymerase IV [Ruminococcaceae bacterium]|nr:DNA polymerase IV [Oscillospiraceae bacterium]
MDRIIFHCDCNSFFASCEELLDPSLRDIPMAVTGDPESRHGVILAKNQKAKKYGIVTGEPVIQAKRKCPSLVCTLSHHDMYREICEKINDIYIEYTDLVEKASIDESYLDVTNTLHLFGNDPKKLADSIRERIKNEIGISISVGVSFCKIIAKFGSDYKKPDATTVIMREDMERIFHKADVGELFLAGKKTVEKLRLLGINTIGELAHYDRDKLGDILGKQGLSLWDNANGKDDSPVMSYYEKQEVKSIGNSMTFKRDLVGYDDIRAGISFLSDSVACRLRKDKKKCTVVQVGIKDTDFRVMQRQTTLKRATNLQKEISEVSMSLIKGNWSPTQPVRLLSVTASGLINEDEDFFQMDLFAAADTGHEKQEKIENTLDDIRRKFGSSAIKFGYFKDDETGIK